MRSQMSDQAWMRLWTWFVTVAVGTTIYVVAMQSVEVRAAPNPVELATTFVAEAREEGREMKDAYDRVKEVLASDGRDAAGLVDAIVEHGPNLTVGQVYDVALAIARNARQYDLRPELVIAVIVVESGFDPRARSNTGDHGLMQLHNRPVYDISENVRLGCQELSTWRSWCRCDEMGMLAHYNGGWNPPNRSWAYAERVLAIANDIVLPSAASDEDKAEAGE